MKEMNFSSNEIAHVFLVGSSSKVFRFRQRPCPASTEYVCFHRSKLQVRWKGLLAERGIA